jgi:uncharacterized protein (TIGR03083 family)
LVDLIAAIRDGAERLAASAGGSPQTPVKRYPDWTMNDLLVHTGTVLRRTTEVVVTQAQERPQRVFPEDESPGPVLTWFRQGAMEMADVLASADPELRVWGFGPDPSVGSWITRMALEINIHAHDAEDSLGDPLPLQPELAAIGIDEFVATWGPHLELEGGGALAMVPTDWKARWPLQAGEDGVAVAPRLPEGAASAAATTSDLLLWMLARVGTDQLDVTGDVTGWDELFRSLPDAKR